MNRAGAGLGENVLFLGSFGPWTVAHRGRWMAQRGGGGGAGAGAPTEQSTTASGPLLPALGMSRFFYPQALPPD